MAHSPESPVPISFIDGRYLLFDIDAVTYLRREHHICGVLMGTLPQIPQQNVFLGLPLELMPEEARLLVEKGIAYIVDESKSQKDGIRNLVEEDRKRYLKALDQEGRKLSQVQTGQKEQRREQALKKAAQKRAAKASALASAEPSPSANQSAADEESQDNLFASEPRMPSAASAASSASSARPSISVEAPFKITPAISYPPFTPPSAASSLPLPDAPASYPLFAHLHAKGYYMSPGLRFGCQYLAYPGDPLRFHSHFLAVSTDWDEEIDLMDLVTGGRLGTGVKKGFLVGGAENAADVDQGKAGDSVRTFSIEWAGM